MTYNNTIEREIDETIKSGKYKVASLDIFNQIEDLELSTKISNRLKSTQELLYEYLNEIMELKDNKPGLKEYLNALKTSDIIDNQSVEKENSFIIGLYMQVRKEAAIEKLIKFSKEQKLLTNNDIYKLNSILLYGTSSENQKSKRETNSKFVGRFDAGERIIDYFPIDYREIEEAATKLAEIYNTRLSQETFDNIFIQPFLIHGLFGALQIFYDGNTRIGRLMQHTLIWQLINEKTEFSFELPPIYATRNYYPYRREYREKISKLVKNGDNEAWNDWFEFNLKRIEDQIYKNNENLSEFRRQQGKTRIYRRY